MCGILGYIRRNSTVDRSEFKKALDLIRHRGPDDQGLYLNPNENIALGHHRLSFLDLSALGKQPLANKEGTIWLTFNGEIYNYLEIKKELEALGQTFKTHSDSEVIVVGYEVWGIDIIHKLEGMFAFGLLDERKQQLFLVRDPFGIKPLYYHHSKEDLIFCSELKSVIALKPALKSIDYTAFADFFVYRYVPSPKSIWKDVQKLPPAHYAKFDIRNHTLELKEYWQPTFARHSMKEKELIEEVDHLLLSSVNHHTRADVPIGSFLSGGYDSSALVYYCSRFGYQPQTFSIGFQDWKKSEHHSAQIVADYFKVPLDSVLANENDLSLIDIMPQVYDEPIADISIIPTYMVSRLARKKVKAVLSGEGADELFGGYHWQKEYYAKKYNAGWLQRIKGLLTPDHPVDFYSNAMSMGNFDKDKLVELMTPDLHLNISDDTNWFYKQHYKPELGHLKSIQWMDVKCFMGELVLTKIDRASMANSLEVRVPFLDRKLFELIFSLEERNYFKPDHTKFVLYKNLEGHLPNSILKRNKQGFVGPDKYYMNKKWYAQLFEKSNLVKDGLINGKFIDQLLSEQYDWRLWKLAVMEKWYSHWMTK